jgi:demethylmenaquinone methyltransferase/2-methoxy-6-polyprenyl-1,4-benzoquinol methylase
VTEISETSPQQIRADLDKQPVDVAAMFDTVAKRYDIVNDLLSAGQTRLWRRAVLSAVNPAVGDVVLDLAAGTGTSSQPFHERGATVIPCDFSLGMLRVGRQRLPHLPFVAGDGMHLPFADDTFDAVTISFGLRNIHDTAAGLAELLRVTKPGGRIVVCEFSQPTWKPLRTLYMEYLMKALPVIARKTSSNPEAYVYLAESIREWPAQRPLAELISSVGWHKVRWRNLSFGIVALHVANKPAK